MFDFLFNAVYILLSGLFSLAFTVFWVWMIIDCVRYEPREGNERLIWIIIMVFVPYIGALVYYLIRRPERIRAFGN